MTIIPLQESDLDAVFGGVTGTRLNPETPSQPVRVGEPPEPDLSVNINKPRESRRGFYGLLSGLSREDRRSFLP